MAEDGELAAGEASGLKLVSPGALDNRLSIQNFSTKFIRLFERQNSTSKLLILKKQYIANYEFLMSDQLLT